MVPQFGIAKLLPVTPISLWFMVDISIVTMVYKPTYNWGVPPCRVVQMDSPFGGMAYDIGDFIGVTPSCHWILTIGNGT